MTLIIFHSKKKLHVFHLADIRKKNSPHKYNENVYLHSFYYFSFLAASFDEIKYSFKKFFTILRQVFGYFFNSHHKRILVLMLLVHWHTFTYIFSPNKAIPAHSLMGKSFYFFYTRRLQQHKNLEMNIQGHVAAIFIFSWYFHSFSHFLSWMKTNLIF